MASKVMVFVGTRKGGFVFSSDAARKEWQASDIQFKSWNVMHMQLDPRDQRLHASVSHNVYGPTTHYSDDFGQTWTQAGQLELNVMMPVIAHNLFEAMQVMIGSIRAFTERAVRGLSANREKAEGWLAKNAIVVTALNPLIGYAQGAELVKEAQARNLPVRAIAMEKARAGLLKHRQGGSPVSEEDIESALGNLRRLTDGGIIE